MWTEVCVAFPTLDALRDGYEVYFVADAIGGVSRVAHESAVQRMIQAGATPISVLGLACELQRDWGRPGADRLRGVMREYFGKMKTVENLAARPTLKSVHLNTRTSVWSGGQRDDDGKRACGISRPPPRKAAVARLGCTCLARPQGRKNSTISRASASGCSIAAKCPPFGMTVQRRMSV